MSKKKILHVDDDPEWRKIITDTIAATGGHQVTSFKSLATARQAFSNGDFDLAIVDGQIHTMDDGLNWAEKLYSQGHPVIICASFGVVGIPFVDKVGFPEAKELLLNLVSEQLNRSGPKL